jgi:L,D-peptidoglycan transpeptidase YkuD (ErfK/YbiS/YcfS/YnhG family)
MVTRHDAQVVSRGSALAAVACVAATAAALGGVFALMPPSRTGVIVGNSAFAGGAASDGTLVGSADLPTESPAASPSPASSSAPSVSPSASAKPSSSPVRAAAKTPARPVVVPAAPAPGNLATRLSRLPASATQVIIVHAAASTTTTATLEAFDKKSGHWEPAFAPMSASIGSHGFSDAKREGDGATPVGMFSIGATMYGLAPDPGVAYRYHQIVENDWWNGNPAAAGYNTFVHGDDPGGASESLWTHTGTYTHFAVINYNTPAVAANPARGSAIFLHQRGAGATAGCVAVSASELERLLIWLRPGASPRIVLSPDQSLSRF